MKDYIVLDLETTGLKPKSGSEIIEIGITEITKGEISNNFSKLIKPKECIPEFITNLTHITNYMVKDSDSIESTLPKFRNYIGDKTVIAHNAKFDIGFINYYLEKNNLDPITDYICTLDILRKDKDYRGIDRKLATACDYYGIQLENAHRADCDTLATAKLFLKLMEGVNE
jgi:DNA polymerase-3 subunit epsilon